MSKISDQLENWDEPHTPRWWYHCKEHPEEPMMRFNDPHFNTAHEGKDKFVFRVRCRDNFCKFCPPIPVSQEDDKPINESEPKQIAPKSSQTVSFIPRMIVPHPKDPSCGAPRTNKWRTRHQRPTPSIPLLSLPKAESEPRVWAIQCQLSTQ